MSFPAFSGLFATMIAAAAAAPDDIPTLQNHYLHMLKSCTETFPLGIQKEYKGLTNHQAFFES